MNIRKATDYSGLFAKLDMLIQAKIPQIELYWNIGAEICSRPEKGAAVAAAEYLHSTYPDIAGFSPRNVRRMREFYCTYQDNPSLMVEAMKIGWTQNVVILDMCETEAERRWYIQAVQQFRWSKQQLIEKIENHVCAKESLDNSDPVCYTTNTAAGANRSGKAAGITAQQPKTQQKIQRKESCRANPHDFLLALHIAAYDHKQQPDSILQVYHEIDPGFLTKLRNIPDCQPPPLASALPFFRKLKWW